MRIARLILARGRSLTPLTAVAVAVFVLPATSVAFAGGQEDGDASADVAFFADEDGAEENGDADAEQRKAFWLGVACANLDEVREDLDLDEDVVGVVVRSVIDDSPAEIAGIKPADVLLAADDTQLENVGALIDAINDADGETMEIQVLRGGETLTVEVTPAERPTEFAPAERPVWDNLREGIRGIERQFLDPDGNLSIWRIGPGVVLGSFPDDLNVNISKEGNTPAKVTVERGDESWQVTEETLDELPDDVRVHVSRFFNRNLAFGPGVVQFDEDEVFRFGGDRERPRRVRVRSRRPRREERIEEEEDVEIHEHAEEDQVEELDFDEDIEIEIDEHEIADRVRALIDEHLGGLMDQLHKEHGDLDRHRRELDERVQEERRRVETHRREIEERLERRQAERQEELGRQAERLEDMIERRVRQLEEVIERKVPELERIIERVLEEIDEHLDAADGEHGDHDDGDDDDGDDDEDGEDDDEDDDSGDDAAVDLNASV